MADNWQLKAVISANAESMLRTLKAVNAATKTTRKYLGDVASSASNLAGRIGLPVALAGGAVAALTVGGLKTIVQNFAELGDQVAKASQRIGMSTAEYQRWKYVAGQSGVSVEGLASSVGRLNRNIAMAATGKNKDLAALFKKAGIDLRDANKHLRDGADLMPEIADLFQRNGNAAVQARMGTAIFNKGYQELLPLLNGGSEEIAKLTARYKMLGLEIDEKSIKAGEAFGDQMEDLNLAMGRFGSTIAAKVIPVISPMVENVIKWTVANRDLLSTKVATFVTGFAQSLADVDWKSVVSGTQSFLSGMKWIVDSVGGVKVALLGLVLFMNAGAIMATLQLAGAVGRLAMFLSGPLVNAMKIAWLVMKACPALLVISLMVAVAAAVVMNWDKIVSYISGAWDRVKSVFSVNFFDGIIQGYLEVWQGFANAILGIIKTITPDVLMPKAMRDFEFTFASDRANRIANGERPSLIGGQQVRASGQINVNFNNPPPGLTVEQSSRGNVPIKTDVGRNGFARDWAYGE